MESRAEQSLGQKVARPTRQGSRESRRGRAPRRRSVLCSAASFSLSSRPLSLQREPLCSHLVAHLRLPPHQPTPLARLDPFIAVTPSSLSRVSHLSSSSSPPLMASSSPPPPPDPNRPNPFNTGCSGTPARPALRRSKTLANPESPARWTREPLADVTNAVLARERRLPLGRLQVRASSPLVPCPRRRPTFERDGTRRGEEAGSAPGKGRPGPTGGYESLLCGSKKPATRAPRL